MSRFGFRFLLAFLVMGLLAGLTKFEIPGNSLLSKEINNAMHFPFYGLLSLLLLGLSFLFLNRIIANRMQHYLIAFMATIVIGGLHEYLQIVGPRDADIGDFGRDVAGTITFLGLYLINDKKMIAHREKWNRKVKLIIYAGAFLVIFYIFTPTAFWAASFLYRNQNFPVICDFESVLENRFLKTQDAVLDITREPYNFGKEKAGNKVGKLTFLVAKYPGLVFREPYPDWSGFKSLNFMAFSNLDFPVGIGIRIEDSQHNNDSNDRFNKTLVISPGINNISILLEEIRYGPTTREMDMMNIRAVRLFMYRPDEEFSLYFDDFRLE